MRRFPWSAAARTGLLLAMLVVVGLAAWSLANVAHNRSSAITQVALSRSGELVAGIDHQGTVRVWRLDTGKLEAEFQIPGQHLTVAFRGEECLAAASAFGKVVLFDVLQGKELGALPNGTSHPKFCADGSRLLAHASFRGDTVLRLWDTSVPTAIAPVELPPLQPQASPGRIDPSLADHVGISANGSTLAFPNGQLIATIDLTTGKREEKRHIASGQFAVLSPDGKMLALQFDDPSDARNVIQLWDLSADREVFKAETSGNVLWLLAKPNRAAILAFSADGKVLAAGTDRVRVWRVSDGNLIRTEGATNDDIRTLALSGDASRLAVATLEGVIRVTNQSGTRQLGRFSLHRPNLFWGWLLAAWGAWCLVAWGVRERAVGPSFTPRRRLAVTVVALWIGIVAVGALLAVNRERGGAWGALGHVMALGISSGFATWVCWAAGRGQPLRLAAVTGFLTVACLCLVEYAPEAAAIPPAQFDTVLPTLLGVFAGILVSIPVGLLVGSVALALARGRWLTMGILMIPLLIVAITVALPPSTLALNFNIHLWVEALLRMEQDAELLNGVVFDLVEAAVRGAVCGLILGCVAVFYLRSPRPSRES